MSYILAHPSCLPLRRSTQIPPRTCPEQAQSPPRTLPEATDTRHPTGSILDDSFRILIASGMILTTPILGDHGGILGGVSLGVFLGVSWGDKGGGIQDTPKICDAPVPRPFPDPYQSFLCLHGVEAGSAASPMGHDRPEELRP